MEILPSRRLPHWRPEAKPLFLTWHLQGSLPECRYPPPGHLSAGAAFVWMDRYLDTARTGPMWLRQEAIARLVAERIRGAADLDRLYELHAWVIMSNHVHLLITPLIDAKELIRRVKGRTAREANLLLGRTGLAFWQAESYDRWVRDEGEFNRIARYIENNPVAAGLVNCAAEYLWSSASNAGAEAPVAG